MDNKNYGNRHWAYKKDEMHELVCIVLHSVVNKWSNLVNADLLALSVKYICPFLANPNITMFIFLCTAVGLSAL